MYTLTSPICIPVTNWRSVNRRSALESFFNNPHTLASAVPLGFCCGGFSSTAGYAPATKLNFRWAALLPSAGPCLRVPFVFIRMARESLATFSSWAFRLR